MATARLTDASQPLRPVQSDMVGRRPVLLGAAAGALAGVRPLRAATSVGKGPDLSAYRLSFKTEFDHPARPLFVKDGGPFTTRYELWGGLRTLPNNKERELYVDPSFVPAAGGTNPAGAADALPYSSGAPLGYNPFALRGGALEISAKPTPPGLQPRVDRPYLSGMISTERSFMQRFGYFEMRAQLPAGQGLWPAFWMVAKTDGEHTEHIEIDIMEALGQDTRNIYQSLIIWPSRGRGVHTRIAMPDSPYDYGMHTYGLDWRERELVYYVDGHETLRTDAQMLRDVPPMYLIANLAVGGSWGGNPDETTRFPAIMRIKYIRAYAPL